MIPLRDVIPSRTTPFITVAIIVLNGLAWFMRARGARRSASGVSADAWASCRRPSARRRSSPRCSCTAAGLTSSGTCGSCGSSATTSKTGWGHLALRRVLCLLRVGSHRWAHHDGSALDAPHHRRKRRHRGDDGRLLRIDTPHSRVLTLVPLFIYWEIVELPAPFLLGFWFLMQLFGAGIGSITPTSGAESGGIAFMAHVAGFALAPSPVFVFRKSGRSPGAGPS